MTPNEVLSKDLQVAPLKPGEVVEYRLHEISTVTNRYNERGQPIPMIPQCQGLSEQTSVIDPVKGKVVIGNVGEYLPTKNPITGNSELKPKYVAPIFTGMSMFVTSDQFELYQYMERHSKNSSNKFRDRKVKTMYYRVDPEAEMRQKIGKDNMEDDAILLIKLSDYKEILAIANGLPEQLKGRVNKDAPIDEIKHNLRKLVKEGTIIPILMASTNNDVKIKVHLSEAEEYGEIVRDDNARTWKWLNGKEICKIDMGTPMLDGLLSFIQKSDKGNDIYRNIVEFLKKMKSHTVE